jgi:hypothetical protein
MDAVLAWAILLLILLMSSIFIFKTFAKEEKVVISTEIEKQQINGIGLIFRNLLLTYFRKEKRHI